MDQDHCIQRKMVAEVTWEGEAAVGIEKRTGIMTGGIGRETLMNDVERGVWTGTEMLETRDKRGKGTVIRRVRGAAAVLFVVLMDDDMLMVIGGRVHTAPYIDMPGPHYDER